MNISDSPARGSKFPIKEEIGNPEVNTAEQDVITNKDGAGKATNKNDAAADADGITETLSGGEPATELNADNHITNKDSASTNELEPDERF